ncbi:MAG: preprotein translocase subunit SecY [Candidatus Firestonebacteria bacterium]
MLKSLVEGLTNIFKIPELKTKVLFTLGMILVYRIGCHVPTPGVDAAVLAAAMKTQAGGVLGFLDLFSGGAFNKFSVFALGIMPYISTSIIMQLLQAVIPSLEKLAKEGEAGKKKITQYTRYGTVLICIVQGSAMTYFMHSAIPGAVKNWGLSFQLTTIITLTAGTIFIMWLGEKMTEKGIGNGMSMIIFAGIVARIPIEIINTGSMIRAGALNAVWVVPVIVGMVALVGFVVLISTGARRIPVQYAQRVVGRRVYGGQSTYLPLKVDFSGVIAIIFASSILSVPAMILQSFSVNIPWLAMIGNWFSPGQAVYSVLYALLIIFFCYFYTAVVFNPPDIAENIKKYGGFIPGVRPGEPTAQFINYSLTRVTLVGALAIVVIALIPDLSMRVMNIPFYFGGTSLLITVGVALDTMKQIESHLLMRNYEGFMKDSKLKSRAGF